MDTKEKDTKEKDGKKKYPFSNMKLDQLNRLQRIYGRESCDNPYLLQIQEEISRRVERATGKSKPAKTEESKPEQKSE